MTAPLFSGVELSQLVAAWLHGADYMRAAHGAFERGHVEIITGRHDGFVYLVRCWLTEPALSDEGRWDSQNSTLLHWFPRADDDGALHDHPWDFRTEILAGGYVEYLPPDDWQHGDVSVGPAYATNVAWRMPGDQVLRRAEDLHCVGALLRPSVMPGSGDLAGGGCWTRVSTGPRRRDWGFHPPGKAWVPYAEFLAKNETA